MCASGRVVCVWVLAGKLKSIPGTTGWRRGHHTEHFSAGLIGEPLGQWNTRANSSNWDTLPITLQGGGDTQTSSVGVILQPKHNSAAGFDVRAAPVVLRGMFVRQQLQVDGLRSPLHAPVLKRQRDTACEVERQQSPGPGENSY